jgi:hypothetical protein
VLVGQVQAEEEHGGEDADRRDHSLVEPDRVCEEERETGAAEDAVDRRDDAGASEQQCRPRPRPAVAIADAVSLSRPGGSKNSSASGRSPR